MAKTTNTVNGEEQYLKLEAIVDEQIEHAEDSHSEILAFVDELKTALGTLVEKASAERSATTSLIDKTRDEVHAFKDSIDQDHSSVESLEGELDDLHDRIRELQEQNETSQSRLDDSKHKLNEKDQKNAVNEVRVKELEATLKEKDSSNEGLDKAKSRIAKLEKALNQQADTVEAGQAAKRKLLELEATVEEYSAATKKEHDRADTLEAKIHELESSRDKESESFDVLESEIQAISEDLTLRTAEVEMERGRAKDLQQLLETTKQESAQELKEKERAVAKLDADFNEVRTDLTAAENAAIDLEENLSKVMVELEDIRGRARKTAEQDETTAKALELTREELKSLNNEIEPLRALPGELDTAKQSLAEKQEHAVRLEEEIEEEKRNGTKSVLAEQLVGALRDREEGLDTIKRLKKEFSRYKKINPPSKKITEPKPDTVENDAPLTEQDDSSQSSAPTKPEVPVVNMEPVDTTPRDLVHVSFSLDEEKRRLGEILMESGVITQNQLAMAVKTQAEGRDNEHIGKIFISMGFAAEDVVAQALAYQMKGQFLRLEIGVVDAKVAEKISGRLAAMHNCIPVKIADGALVVAMENPLDLIALEDLERTTNMQIEPVVATSKDIEWALETYYTS